MVLLHPNSTLFIRTATQYKCVHLDDILTIESYKHNNALIRTKKKEYIVYQTLKKIEDEIKSPHLCRVHRCHIVNMLNVDRIEGDIIIMNNGVTIDIGRFYKKVLRNKFTIIG